eukprot:2103061-Karenia_brevis.AAC.1
MILFLGMGEVDEVPVDNTAAQQPLKTLIAGNEEEEKQEQQQQLESAMDFPELSSSSTGGE